MGIVDRVLSWRRSGSARLQHGTAWREGVLSANRAECVSRNGCRVRGGSRSRFGRVHATAQPALRREGGADQRLRRGGSDQRLRRKGSPASCASRSAHRSCSAPSRRRSARSDRGSQPAIASAGRAVAARATGAQHAGTGVVRAEDQRSAGIVGAGGGLRAVRDCCFPPYALPAAERSGVAAAVCALTIARWERAMQCAMALVTTWHRLARGGTAVTQRPADGRSAGARSRSAKVCVPARGDRASARPMPVRLLPSGAAEISIRQISGQPRACRNRARQWIRARGALARRGREVHQTARIRPRTRSRSPLVRGLGGRSRLAARSPRQAATTPDSQHAVRQLQRVGAGVEPTDAPSFSTVLAVFACAPLSCVQGGGMPRREDGRTWSRVVEDRSGEVALSAVAKSWRQTCRGLGKLGCGGWFRSSGGNGQKGRRNWRSRGARADLAPPGDSVGESGAERCGWGRGARRRLHTVFP